MIWYNPTRGINEGVPDPLNDAQAIKMLSGHPGSKRFIEEYRRLRATHQNIVEALVHTGEVSYEEHLRDQPQGKGVAPTRLSSRN